MVECAAVYHEEEQGVTIFAVNRSLSENVTLECNVESFEGYHLVEHLVLENQDLKAVNTLRNSPVLPHSNGVSVVDEGILTSVLNKTSWNVIRLAHN